MTNRNDNTLVAPSEPVQQNTKPHNGLFDFVNPTAFVDLPSKGQFYNDEHPLKNKDSIEIKYMTAKDEDTLSSESYLKKGVAIDRFLENIIVDDKITPEGLVIADKNAIIIEARILAYGNLYESKISCPSCEKIQLFEFNLNDKFVYHGDDSDIYEFNEKGNLLIQLPESNVILEVKILTGKEEKQFIKKISSNKKNTSKLSDQYKMMIVSANGVNDEGLINKFIDLMPVADSKFLRGVYSEVAPTIKIIDNFACHSCGHEQELEVPFGADFLWPRT